MTVVDDSGAVVELPPPPPPPPPGDGDPGRPLPQPEEQEAHIEDAHTFSAPLFGDAPAGGWMPSPVVRIGAGVVASAPDSSLSKPLVVDGLSVSWGRSSVMDQPDPATATLTCFDPTAAWPLTTDLRGQLVTLSWLFDGPGYLPSAFFVGRITGAKLTRKTVVKEDGTKVHGLLIALTAASILNDLANRIPAESWPDEDMGSRRARIASYAANVCTGGVVIRNYWATPHVAPVDISEQVSILDHLMSLYESSGPDRMTFIPWQQLSMFVGRRDYPGIRTLAALHWNVAGEGTARDGRGAYAWTIAFPSAENGMSTTNLYLDGAAIEYPDNSSLTKDVTAMITRVDVSHPDAANANQTRVETALVSSVNPAVDELSVGVRTARLDSSVNWNAFAAQAASDLAYMAAREAAGWRPDPITIRTKSSTFYGFDSFQLAGYALVGGEVASTWFIQRSWFAQLGIRPIFAIIGGAIRYQSGEWIVDAELAPVNTLPAKQHAISWSEIDDGSSTYELQWWDDDNPRGLHESLTYEDIGFVGMGLGMTTVPADTYGWDQTYP